ncbi:MAG: Ig-like domain-containing protein [Acetatifactor sp.]|nr:Ig-like domain-containing protein [Acetatifactor sp.]
MKKFFERYQDNEENWEDFEDTAENWDGESEEFETFVESDAEDALYYAEETEYYAEEAEEFVEPEEYYGEADSFEADATDATDTFETEEFEVEPEGYYEEEEYYVESEDATYYTEEPEGYYVESEDTAYYAEEEEYYAEEEEQPYYEDIDYYAEEDGEYESEEETRPFAWFFRMTAMDRVMLGAGVCALVLAVVTGVVFLRSRTAASQTSAFGTVGTQLEDIEVIGDSGLLAVADATIGRQEAAKILDQENEEKGQNGQQYEEADYNKAVTVALKTVSVQKDLKIKFVNKSSDKLIPNVPFVVTVTTPDGKSETWSDDDMDGIIYKKGITPGSYKVAVNALSGEKYTKYTLPSDTRTAEVKKDIAYQKIDVSDEVKTESQVNVATEEQKKQEPEVESSLTDTVEWVESTAVTSTYIEVSRSNITDPMLQVKLGSFLRMAKEVSLNQTSATLKVGGRDLKLKASHSLDEVLYVTWNSSDSSVAEVDVDGVVTAVSPGTATITCVVGALVEKDGEMEEVEYEAGCKVTVTDEEPFAGTVSVDAPFVELMVKEKETVQVTPDGFEEGKTLSYSAVSDDTKVAKVTIDKKGKLTITAVGAGEATVTVVVNYASKPVDDPPAADISVVVGDVGSIRLDRTTATVDIGSSVTIDVLLENVSDTEVKAKSSDNKIATVEVDGESVIITGVKAGTATITVTAKDDDGETISATCAVTVKRHSDNEASTPLKDNSGNQLYVQENGTYREAVCADYYKDGVKFFKRGETKYTGWQTIGGKVYFFDASGKKVTGEQVIQGAKYTFDSDGALVTGSGTMGIDVSKHNGTIDWNAVKNSGVSYVIIRCGYRGYTQGSLIIDPKFEQNIKGATAAGLKVGVYFFSQAVDEVEAVEEASFVLEAVKGYRISYPIFLDVEYSGASGNKGRADNLGRAERTAVCKAFCATVSSGGYTAGIYANKTWLETMLDPGQLSAYKIWLAQYAAAPTYGGRYDLWQYKSTGKVSGISGNVDMNLSYMGY